MLTFDELKRAIANDEIDTVIAAQTDMQGRLMDKRFHAKFFIDSAWEETHSCNYLLATDMEMSTVGGYHATGWGRGYGDYVMKPGLSTLRRIPWLNKTALYKGYRNLSPAEPYKVENSKGEADAGQMEINIRYATALDMADRHVIVKNGGKEIAWASEQALTFMAKWHNAAAGSSCHIHQSLRNDTGAPLFYDTDDQYGISATMKRMYVADLNEHE